MYIVLYVKYITRCTNMNIPLIASIDKSTFEIKREVIPFISSLSNDFYRLGDLRHEKLFLCDRHSQQAQLFENIVMSLSLDPKSCKIPYESCSTDCETGCTHSLLIKMMEQELCGRRPLVLTCQDTINTLLNVSIMLIKFIKNIPFSDRWYDFDNLMKNT